MASIVRQKDWSDFDWFVDSYIPRQTVRTLKDFGDHIRDKSGIQIFFRTGELKAAHVSKIQNAFKTMKQNNALEQYAAAREACEQYGTPQWRSHVQHAPTFGGTPVSGSPAAYGAPPRQPIAGPSRVPYAGSTGSSPGKGGWSSTSSASNVYNQHTRGSHFTLQDWKANPMWKPIKALTNMEALPAQESSHTRRDKRVSLQLPGDVLEKLQQSKNNPSAVPQYSIRLFCASSDYYRPTGAPYSAATAHITNRAVPIEFPNNPDITVDSYTIPFKEKGLRGQPGSAPPFDVGKSPRGLQLSPGRLTSVSFGHTGPTTGKRKEITKRFFFQLVFTETTTKEELLTRLKSLTPTPASEALAMTRQSLDDEDDIQFGSSVLKLKDPLSYMRIETPVRSKQCTHVQCFEAKWWIEQNNTHPRWRCPHCDRELNFADIIVDGAFLDILNAVNDDVEEVVLEADGEWHTENGKFGSPAWLAAHEKSEHAANGVPTPAASTNGATPQPPHGSASPEKKPKRPIVELLSESEDEDEQPATARPRLDSQAPLSSAARPPHPVSARPPFPGPTPSATSSRMSSAAPLSNDVIDLTLDSDDEDVPPRSTPAPVGLNPGVSRPRSESTESPFLRPGVENGRLSVDGSSHPTRMPAPDLSRKLPELGAPHPAWGSTSRPEHGATQHNSHLEARDPRLAPRSGWGNSGFSAYTARPPAAPHPLSRSMPPPQPGSDFRMQNYSSGSSGWSRPLAPFPLSAEARSTSYADRSYRLPPVQSASASSSSPTLASSWRPDRSSPAYVPPNGTGRDTRVQSHDSTRSDESRRNVSAEIPRYDRWSDLNEYREPAHENVADGSGSSAARRTPASTWAAGDRGEQDSLDDDLTFAMEEATRDWEKQTQQRRSHDGE